MALLQNPPFGKVVFKSESYLVQQQNGQIYEYKRENETFAQKPRSLKLISSVKINPLGISQHITGCDVCCILSVMVLPSGQVSKPMLKSVPKTPNTKFKHTEHHSAVPSSLYPRERERLQS